MRECVKKFSGKSRIALLAMLMVLAILVSVYGTMALLKTQSNGVINTFQPFEKPSTTVTVNEDYDPATSLKKNVSVTNEGSIAAYVRLQLVTYRVNKDGNPIGGVATIPTFTPGEGWLDMGNNLYVYSKPVARKSSPDADLIGDTGITLLEYDDEDGGVQVVEVIAESIEANPATSVETAWGVTVNDGVISLKGDK